MRESFNCFLDVKSALGLLPPAPLKLRKCFVSFDFYITRGLGSSRGGYCSAFLFAFAFCASLLLKILLMKRAPGQAAFTTAEWKVVNAHRTPAQVQRFLRRMPYNWEREGGTLRSFREVIKRGEAHCLEAALAAAVILEQHGYPPRLLSLESQDKLDHVIFVFQKNGRWGSIGRSRDLGLHGRRPVFRSLRALAWSYFDPYIDYTGRITGYGATNLYELGNYDWRFSPRNVLKVEDHLREIPHRALHSSDKRYDQLLARYKEFKQLHPKAQPVYYKHRELWML